MTLLAAQRDRPKGPDGAQWLTSLRLAVRDLRGGVRGFYVLLAAIALGVLAIAAVGSVAASLDNGLARDGRVILGGDIAFALHREANPAERAFLESQGQVSSVATLRTMARAADGRAALVEVKAVDDAYPLFGSIGLTAEEPLASALAERDGLFGAAADEGLLARLDLKPGDRLSIGTVTVELRAVLTAEPDKLAGGIGFGPRLIISQQALRASGLLQPGSLVRWTYRLRLPAEHNNEQAVQSVLTAAGEKFPQAGWDIRTRRNASPSLQQSVERFSQFLTLVALTALLVGGVGVANAIKGHLDRRRATIATLKSLGASGRRVFAIYLLQVWGLAVVGALPGLAIGAALPFVLAWGFGNVLPLPLAPALAGGALALALGFGLLTALAFALWPLGRAHDVPVAALFRDEVAGGTRRPRAIYIGLTILTAAALAALAILTAEDRRIAAIFIGAALLVFAALWVIASLIKLVARNLPRPGSTPLRMALANIHRPGALTTSLILSLGLGLALLVTVVEIDGNLRHEFQAALPSTAPAFFFLDIQAAEAERFDRFIQAQAPEARLDRVPMLRGRIMAVNGVPAEELKPAASAAWVLQSDRGITFGNEVPAGSRVVAGEWWPPNYQGPPLVSFEQKVAEGLGLKLGDPVTVNVLGRNITARVANLRALDWQNLGINFVMVFSPNTFRGAPVTDIATLTYRGGATPQQEAALLKALAEAFPAVTAIRVRDALDAIGTLVRHLIVAIRGASALTLLVAVLVLGGALAAGHRQRLYDAMVLKTLGATRGTLMLAYALEYSTLGAATALFGVAAGSAAAAFVLENVMKLSFDWLPGPALLAALGAVAVTVVLGLIGSFPILGEKPARVLREL